MSRSFNGTQTFNGIVCQKYVYEQDFAATSEGLMKVTVNDVKYYGAAASPTTDATVILQFPLQVGNNWVLSGSYTATVEAYESITVPAGTYNAFRVLNDYGVPINRYHYWYAKDVGIVAFEIYWVSGMSTVELTSKNF